MVAVVVAAFVAACGGGSTPTAPASAPDPTPVPTAVPLPAVTLPPVESVKVTLGIYSGRPDPVWQLTPVQVARLRELVDALPVASGLAPQGGLGYHGFSAWLATADQAHTVVAYRGTVAIADRGATTYWRDDTRVVERYLLDTGKPSLTPDEIAIVEAALASPLP